MTFLRTATVFGGTGLLGHAVIQELVGEGYVVRVPTRELDKTKNLRNMGRVGQVIPFVASIKTDAAVGASLAGSELVINLIGSGLESEQEISAHVETAARIARVAHGEGVSCFIHVTAKGVSLASQEPWMKTRGLGEEAVRAFLPKAIIVHPDLMFGRGDRLLSWVAQMSRYIPFVPVGNNGDARMFRPAFVGDIAKAIVAACKNKDACGRTLVLSGPKSYTVRSLVEAALKKASPQKPLLRVPKGIAKQAAFFLSPLPTQAMTQMLLAPVKNDYPVEQKEILSFNSMKIKPRGLEEK